MEQNDNRIVIIGITWSITDLGALNIINEILKGYVGCVINKNEVRYPDKNLIIMSITLDAPMSAIGAITGKLGMVEGVRSKTVYLN